MISTYSNESCTQHSEHAKPLNQQFYHDVLHGLSLSNKRLESKYFYDQKGDALFQQIMECPEYYPTRCETEIFQSQSNDMASLICDSFETFDLIELGAGDATKSQYLLQTLLAYNAAFTYMPIDISGNILSVLQQRLENELPALHVEPYQGEYFQMLRKASLSSQRPKVVLFLGGNIGNMELEEAGQFCRNLRQALSPGDLVLMGFDLKKHPQIVLNAYNDSQGLTARFNLNLLARINRELDADFNLDSFSHYPNYDPVSGACRSYLISHCDQLVHVSGQPIHFYQNEPIFMEVSQKFSLQQIDELGRLSGFVSVRSHTDSEGWFVDNFWRVA